MKHETVIQKHKVNGASLMTHATDPLRHGQTDSKSLRCIQPKLTVGAPGDVYEKEADAVADKIMRMPEKSFVQRKCAACEKEEKTVQRKPLSETVTPFIQTKTGNNTPVVSDSLSHSIESSKGSGSVMDSSTNSFMSKRFGSDFSNVKIHTGGEAIQMNRELDAKAFTVGNDIYFNEGQYQPHSESGKHLLAHELTHTIQQAGTIQRAPASCADKDLCGKPTKERMNRMGPLFICLCDLSFLDFASGPGYVGKDVTEQFDNLNSNFAAPVRSMWFKTGTAKTKLSLPDKPAWGINAVHSAFEPPLPASTPSLFASVDVGFIQTVENVEWKAEYTDGWETSTSASNARDASAGAAAPWKESATGQGPVALTSSGISAVNGDEPSIKLLTNPLEAPCSSLQKVTTKGKYNIWFVALDRTVTPSVSSITFLKNIAIEQNKKWELKAGGNSLSELDWLPSGSQTKTIGDGQGAGTPVLDAPVANAELQKNFSTKKGKSCAVTDKLLKDAQDARNATGMKGTNSQLLMQRILVKYFNMPAFAVDSADNIFYSLDYNDKITGFDLVPKKIGNINKASIVAGKDFLDNVTDVKLFNTLQKIHNAVALATSWRVGRATPKKTNFSF